MGIDLAKKEEVVEEAEEEDKQIDTNIYKKQQFVQNKEIIFEEYLIEPDVEQLHVSKMYFK